MKDAIVFTFNASSRLGEMRVLPRYVRLVFFLVFFLLGAGQILGCANTVSSSGSKADILTAFDET